jgi:lysine 2,3-aminomutase
LALTKAAASDRNFKLTHDPFSSEVDTGSHVGDVSQQRHHYENATNSSPSSAADLVAAGLVPEEHLGAIEKVGKRYAIGLTPTIAEIIDRTDPADPIARQFIPDPAELDVAAWEKQDPIGDAAFSPVEGIVHRYPDRVLLKLLHACPVYCRFCFRREFVGPGGSTHLTPEALDRAFGYIAARPEIWEVILTGGDPLMLSLRRLADVTARLAASSHVKVLRIHTRVPAVDPARITDALLALLRSCGKTVYVVLHANHPRELSPEARAACARILDAGIPMLSQSVLLAGVNDNLETLEALMRAFVEARIKPYYLHQLDPAPGTARFAVSLERGQALMRGLLGRVSGLCRPAYMLDLPGGFGKVPVGPNYLSQRTRTDSVTIEDPSGREHLYRVPAETLDPDPRQSGDTVREQRFSAER